MASSRSFSFWPAVTIVVAIVALFIALPDSLKQWLPEGFPSPSIHYGLDLAGGAQLDFRISEQEIEEQLRSLDEQIANTKDAEQLNTLRLQRQTIEEQRANIVEAIRAVLERRVNSLGVSEATITPSYIGNEKHLLVDFPGVLDTQKAIETVGKTIQLEFKEEQKEADANYQAEVRAKADRAMQTITRSGASLETVGQDFKQLGVSYIPSQMFFKDELPAGLESVWSKKPGAGVIRLEGTVKQQTTDANGKPAETSVPGIFLVEVLSPATATGRVIDNAAEAFKQLVSEDKENRTYNTRELATLPAGTDANIVSALKTQQPGELKAITASDGSSHILFVRQSAPGREEVDVSHVLVAYKGAQAAPANVTRTKEEALARAQEFKKQIDAGAKLEDIARGQSDATSGAAAGHLPPVTRGSIVPSFENVAFSQAVGVVSEPVETPFGYHLIRVNKAPYHTQDQYSYDELVIKGAKAGSLGTELVTRMQEGKVTRTEDAITLRVLFFSLAPTGWKDTPLTGKHFRNANVTTDPNTNIPVVQIVFDEEGAKMFAELTKRNVGKRIAIFVGGELITDPVVETEISNGVAIITGNRDFQAARTLAQDLNTGSIPAPIYLAGQRTVEPTLGAEALSISLYAAIVGIIVVMIYMVVMYRLLGLVANVALVIYGLLLVVLMKLPLFLVSSQYVVLTLAGIAGIILSLGMSLDLNVLIFERMKEELRKGKMFKTAAELGFERAWSSIFDSNISTLITCAILFIIGTSIVRGFAITLALGIVVSLFTGITVSRALVRLLANTRWADKPWLFGVSRK